MKLFLTNLFILRLSLKSLIYRQNLPSSWVMNSDFILCLISNHHEYKGLFLFGDLISHYLEMWRNVLWKGYNSI